MEVKPKLPTLQRTDEDFDKIAQFVIDTKKNVWLCAGLEHVPDNVIFYDSRGRERVNYWQERLRTVLADPEKTCLTSWWGKKGEEKRHPSVEELEKATRWELNAATESGDRFDYEINDVLPQPNGTFSYGFNPYEPEWGWNPFWDRALIAARSARFEW